MKSIIYVILFLLTVFTSAEAKTKIKVQCRKGNIIALLNWSPINNIENYKIDYKVKRLVSWHSLTTRIPRVRLKNLKENRVYEWRIKSGKTIIDKGTFKTGKKVANTASSMAMYLYTPIEQDRDIELFYTKNDSVFLSYSNPSLKKYTLTGSVQRTSGNTVANVFLDVESGSNQYIIDLKEIYDLWEENSIYLFKFVWENGKESVLKFRYNAPPEVEDIVSIISLNPVNVNCEDRNANIIIFEASLWKSKAPYTVRWEVSKDKDRKKLLYKPYTEKVENLDKQPRLVVTEPVSKGYYVTLTARDVCGKEITEQAYIQCEVKQKKKKSFSFKVESVVPRSSKKE